MSFIPKPHEIYKHFKGNLYQITAIAEHTENGETLVVYQAMYGDFKTYARPLSMFVSRVDRAKYPDAGQEFRFELQGPEAARQRTELEDQPETAGKGMEVRPGITGQGREMEDRPGITGQGREMEDQPGITGQGTEMKAQPGEPAAQSVKAELNSKEPAGPKAEPEVAAWAPVSKESDEELTEGELALDPMVLEFLDADSYEQRLNILAGLHHRITDGMITTMAIACDVEIDSGETEERYEALKNCLITLERYECQRIR